MSKQYRIAVVGSGFGKVHVQAVRTDPRCEVVAIAASRMERATEAAEALGIPDACDDWLAMFRRDDIDGVTIAVPPFEQAEIALGALRCEKAVFCEKPLSDSDIQAEDMAQAAARSGRAHMVNFEIPQADAWQRAKAMLDDGQIGELQSVVVNWNVLTYANLNRLDNWKTQSEAGGGTLNNFGSHVLHYLEWFAGRIARMNVRLGRAEDDNRRSDTYVNMWVEFANRATAAVSIDADAGPGKSHRVELNGSRGSLWLVNQTNDYASGFELLHGDRQSSSMTVEVTEAAETEGEPVDGRVAATGRLISRWIDWMETGTEVSPNFDDGLRVQRLIEEARRSSSHESWMDVAR